MTQYPHDEFDDIAPYSSEEAGKHRAAAGAGAPRGSLKWIGLLAALVLVVGLVSFVLSRGGDEELVAGDEPTVEDIETAGSDATSNGSEETEPADDDGDSDGSNGDDAATESEGGDGDEPNDDAGTDEEPTVDSETPVTVYNLNAPAGSAGEVTDALSGGQFNTLPADDWNPGWGAVETPQIIIPSEDERGLAEVIGAELGIDTIRVSSAWDSVAVVVGPEGAP